MLPYFPQIQNDQCQEMDQSSEAKWLKLTNHGEWATHTVSVTIGEPKELLPVLSSTRCYLVVQRLVVVFATFDISR